MDEQSSQNGHRVPAELLPQCGGVTHVQDPRSHQKDDPKREIPYEENETNQEQVLS